MDNNLYVVIFVQNFFTKLFFLRQKKEENKRLEEK